MAKGRKRQSGVARYENGRKKRPTQSDMQRMEDANKAVGIAARMRVHGIGEELARIPAGGTVVGRMAYTGELAPTEQAQDLVEAAEEFSKRHAAYSVAIDAKHLKTATDYTGILRPDFSGGGTADRYVEWCAEASRKYSEMRRSILECGDPLAMLALETCVLGDKRPAGEVMMGALRCGLNAVSRVLRSPRARAA